MAERKGRPSVASTKYDESYFLTACEGYEEFLDSEGMHLSRRLDQAFAAADVMPGMRILDIGCGRGEILRRCAQFGAAPFGVDYAWTAVQLSHKLANGPQEGTRERNQSPEKSEGYNDRCVPSRRKTPTFPVQFL